MRFKQVSVLIGIIVYYILIGITVYQLYTFRSNREIFSFYTEFVIGMSFSQVLLYNVGFSWLFLDCPIEYGTVD